MPIVEMVRQADEFISYQYDFLPPVSVVFNSGSTMPIYEPNTNIDAASKNIGNLPGVTRTEYGSTVNGGVTQLNSAVTISNTNFTNTVVDIRANIVFNNCRFTLTSYTPADAVNALIRALNGGSVNNIVFNDCEFHMRAQRSMNIFSGRNTTFNRCVLTGGTDGLSLSNGGSAQQSYGFIVNDCWIGDHGWWRWTTTGVVHPSDTQTHNDGIQVSVATLGVEVNNTFFGTWPSEFVGTGTPGSGSETNPYAGTYITNQATMESWRATYLNVYTRADQSFGGIQRRSSSGGSWACIMVNRAGITIDNCWFSGGAVQINAVDPNLAGQTVGSITNSHHWNDMSAGHSLTSTAKGTAIYRRTDYTMTVPTSGTDKNTWFDGATVMPVEM
ncbi:MAG: hypothetical protein WAQ27_06185 [Candidatus Microsaccharimonas sp.]